MDQGKQSSAMSPLVDFGTVCQKVRESVEPARVHAVSLHDNKGDVLWLTESSMGPDEHNAVREAFEAFSNPNGPPVLDYDLGDHTGVDFLHWLRLKKRVSGIPVFMFSGSAGRRNIEECYSNGANHSSSSQATSLDLK